MNKAEFRVEEVLAGLWQISVAGIDNVIYAIEDTHSIKFLQEMED